MKVICNRGALQEALTVAGMVVATRSPKPVLACVKLSAEDGVLTVSATDLEVGIRYSDRQVQVEVPGATLVRADHLRDIVRESVDDTVSIERTGDNAHIRGNDSHFKIFTQNADDFPPVGEFEGEPDFSIEAGTLKRMISQTLFSAAREASRYAFNGVLLVAKGKSVTFVSTDGRRLAQAKGDLTTNVANKDGVRAIVPSKALNLIDKLLGDPEESVAVQIKENRVMFKTASAALTSNLVEGQFPPYDEVIPKESDKKMTASTAEFLSAIRRSALLTSEESKGVRLAFSKKGLVLTSRSPESGDATVNFACKFDGADVEIGFNPAFLVDALRVTDTDEITLDMTTGNRPALLKGGPNFQYVIMPVNLA